MDIISKEKAVQNLLHTNKVVGLNANVKMFFDRSVSAKGLFDNHIIQQIAERVMPIGLALDPSHSVDAYVFEDKITKLSSPITADNYVGYIDRMTDDLPYGGTMYGPVIRQLLIDSGATATEVVTYMKAVKKGGFAGFFSKDTSKETKETIHVHPTGKTKIPTLGIVFTDGDADDGTIAERMLEDASKYPAFYAFIGLQGNPKPSFKLLKEMDTMKGRFIDNASFNEITPQTLINSTDEQFYRMILGEFTESWIHNAKEQFLIK